MITVSSDPFQIHWNFLNLQRAIQEDNVFDLVRHLFASFPVPSPPTTFPSQVWRTQYVQATDVSDLVSKKPLRRTGDIELVINNCRLFDMSLLSSSLTESQIDQFYFPTLLHIASSSNSPSVVEWILQHCPGLLRVPCALLNGWTPLHAAVFNGCDRCVALLQIHFSSSTISTVGCKDYDADNYTPVDLAHFLTIDISSPIACGGIALNLLRRRQNNTYQRIMALLGQEARIASDNDTLTEQRSKSHLKKLPDEKRWSIDDVDRINKWKLLQSWRLRTIRALTLSMIDLLKTLLMEKEEMMRQRLIETETMFMALWITFYEVHVFRPNLNICKANEEARKAEALLLANQSSTKKGKRKGKKKGKRR